MIDRSGADASSSPMLCQTRIIGDILIWVFGNKSRLGAPLFETIPPHFLLGPLPALFPYFTRCNPWSVVSFCNLVFVQPAIWNGVYRPYGCLINLQLCNLIKAQCTHGGDCVLFKQNIKYTHPEGNLHKMMFIFQHLCRKQ